MREQVLWGHNFADGRGNVTLSAAYTLQDAITAQDRNFDEPFGFVGSLTNPAVNIPVTGGAFILSSDLGRPSTYFGLGGVNATTGAPFGFYTNAAGQPLTFDASGNLVPFNPGKPAGAVFAGAALVTIPPGSDTTSTREMPDVLQPSQRVFINGMAHYDLTDNVTVFGRFSYAQTTAQFDNPAPIVFALGGYPDPNTYSLAINPATNPFLTPSSRAYFLNPANQSPFGPTIYLNRQLADINPGTEDIDQKTWTAQAGFEGKFKVADRDFKWDLTFSDGETTRDLTMIGIPSQNFANANQAVYASPGVGGGPLGGTVIPVPANLSLSDFTYNAATHVYVQNGTGDLMTCASRLTTNNNCAPYNPFGAQNPQDALNYLRQQQYQDSRIQQQYVEGNVNGSLFDLPAGPLQWAAGFDVRREEANFSLDPYENIDNPLSQGGTYYLGYPHGAPISGSFTTKEIYTEIRAPLIDADMMRSAMGFALFKKLTFEGAVRYMDDSITGSDVAWTAGGELQLNDDLMFRGNRTHSVRQPAIGELFAGTIPEFQSITDPCAVGIISTGPNPANRKANCEQSVINAGLAGNVAAADAFLSTFTSPLAGINGDFSGNTHLHSEVAESWTAGMVFTPRTLPGFMLTVDWIDIDIKGAIAALGGEGVADACYDAPNLNNNYCTAISRNPANFSISGFQSFDVNLNTRDFAGLTVQARYSNVDVARLFGQTPGDWGSLSANVLLFYQAHDLSGIVGEGVQDDTTSSGAERYRVQGGLDWKVAKWDVYWQTTFYGASKVSSESPSIFLYNDIKPYYLNDLAVNYDVTPNLRLQMVVDNVLDAKPPFNSFSYQYDRLGRRFELGVKAKF